MLKPLALLLFGARRSKRLPLPDNLCVTVPILYAIVETTSGWTGCREGLADGSGRAQKRQPPSVEAFLARAPAAPRARRFRSPAHEQTQISPRPTVLPSRAARPHANGQTAVEHAAKRPRGSLVAARAAAAHTRTAVAELAPKSAVPQWQ